MLAGSLNAIKRLTFYRKAIEKEYRGKRERGEEKGE